MNIALLLLGAVLAPNHVIAHLETKPELPAFLPTTILANRYNPNRENTPPQKPDVASAENYYWANQFTAALIHFSDDSVRNRLI